MIRYTTPKRQSTNESKQQNRTGWIKWAAKKNASAMSSQSLPLHANESSECRPMKQGDGVFLGGKNKFSAAENLIKKYHIFVVLS